MSDSCTIFIAYSSTDVEYLRTLRNHLKALELSERVKVWYDGEIDAGADWAASTQRALETADIILLLISADAIASSSFYSDQLQVSLKRYEEEAAHVIPIIVRPCHWQILSIGHLKALPQNGKPVSSCANQDEAWTEIIFYLERVVNKVLSIQAEPSSSTHHLIAPDSIPKRLTGVQNGLLKRGSVMYTIYLIIIFTMFIGGLMWYQNKQKETDAWFKLQLNPTIHGLNGYLEVYPDGRYTGEAKTLLGELKEQRDWELTRAAGDIPAYEAYLKQHSDGEHHKEAFNVIKNLQEDLEIHIKNAEIYLKNDMYEAADEELSKADSINPLDERISNLKTKIK